MAYSSITSWQKEREKVKAMTDFIFLGSKITADSNCNHEIKMLAPWKGNNDKFRQCIKNQRQHFC